MKKRFSIIALLLCTSLTFAGCSNTKYNEDQELNNTINTTDSEANSEQRKLNVLRPMAYGNVEGLTLEPGSSISIIGKYAGDSYWKEVEAGAKRAIKDINDMLGYEGKDKVTLTYSAPEIRDDVEEQINILDEELSRYPTAIGIAAIDTTACAIQFDLASDNQIPIVTFDSGSDYKQVASHISTDNLEAASTAATKLAHAINKEGEVLILAHDSISMTGKERLKGFQDTIAEEYENITIANVYELDNFDELRSQIAAEHVDDPEFNASELSKREVLTYLIQSNPNLKGIFATNLDTTQLVAKALSDIPEHQIKVVGFDGGEDQLTLLEDGVLEGLIIQNPYGMGYATVVSAARTALGLGNESIVDSGYTWVTKDNMTTNTIKGMLY